MQKAPHPTFQHGETSVFEVISRLAQRHKAINLGQGFAEYGFPQDVIAHAAWALHHRSNQYPPLMGLPELRQAVAAHDRRFYKIDVDWQTSTLVTSGATEALTAALMALIEPGDEAVLIEPLYDCYAPIIERLGGIVRCVTLQPPDWQLPRQALAAAFSPRTKVVVVNSPHNPTGRVLGAADLALIADLVRQHGCYALCDEVYEHLLFDGRQHIPLLTLAGMHARCIRVGSAGKTFSLTGWKVGYVVAEPELLQCIARAHQYLVFATPPHLQSAVAMGLAKDDAFFLALRSTLQAKRDRFAAGCKNLGLQVCLSEGTYFAAVAIPEGQNDVAFCEALIEHGGVAAIPMRSFYRSADAPCWMRFCFAKPDEVLDAALGRLQAFLRGQPRQVAAHPAPPAINQRPAAAVDAGLMGAFVHLVRNALTSSVFCFEALTMSLDETTRPPAEELREALAGARRGIDRALRAAGRVSQIVHTVRRGIEPGATAAVNRTLQSVLYGCREALAAHAITVEQALPSGLQFDIEQTHLEALLTELIGNARRACAQRHPDHGGHIVIEALCGENSCDLRVADNGPGLSAEATTRLFEPFFSTHTADACGLGLVLCRLVLDLYGATLRLENTGDGGGACAIVHLPRRQTK